MKPLQLYNTFSASKQPFEPLTPGEVKLYVCGMTVYDYCHIGHARVLVVFDMLVRYLRATGYRVTYVRNITDIDDKIIQRAQENQQPVEALTAEFIEAMHQDEAALGLQRPDHEPRATEYVDSMIAFIGQLIEKSYAYVGESGDVYYDISKFEAYGRLSKQDLAQLQAGARIAVEAAKRNPLDFVLWKQAKPGEPAWDSPWGEGRPGWHIECSTMSTDLFGAQFDLHGGGQDLTFPHHENEIAQSEALSGQCCVSHWLHVGYLQINDEKMSKSLGNFLTIREVLARHAPEAVRYFLLAGHYRKPLNYSEDNLKQADSSLRRLYAALRDVELADQPAPEFAEREAFFAAMQDDLNTAEALASLFELARQLNRAKAAGEGELASQLAANLCYLGGMLGLLQAQPDDFLHAGLSEAQVAEIEQLLVERSAARAAKDWPAADAIRDQLTALQVEVEDTPDGTIWRK